MLLPIVVIVAVFSRIEIAVAVISCKVPEDPENGKVAYSTLTTGSKLIFDCENGYHLQDTRPVYCTSDGEWNKTDVKCVAKTCDPPNHPKNGQVIFESLTFRSQLKFKCDDGYVLNTREPVLCTSEGTWSNPSVQCVAKACDPPVHPDNGQVSFTSLNIGSQLKFKCDDGYILKPNKPVICAPDGTWNSTDVRCVDGSDDVTEDDISKNPASNDDAFKPTEPNVNDSTVVPVKNVCGPPPKVEGTQEPHLNVTEVVVGTAITYRCEFGYVNQDSKNLRSFCQWNSVLNRGIWTTPDVVCIPRSCGEPGFVSNAHRIGNLFTFPNKVEFQCQEGYKLKGPAVRYCQASGTWSGRLPKCDQINCAPPANPENGRVRYISLEYGTELKYECDKRFVLSQHETRTCTADGTWSNTEPVCIEGSCEIPLAPKNGNVHIVGTPTVGTVAVYSCNEGKKMVGPSISKCLITGEWTFPPPKCLSPCVLSAVPYGSVGRIETRRGSRYNTEERFVEFQVGKLFQDEETAIFRCSDGFEPVWSSQPSEDRRRFDEVVTCKDGQWSKLLECKPESCYGEPPPVDNGYPMVNNRSHGFGINYHCDNYYVKGENGDVKCSYGQWTGKRPTCIDSRCYVWKLDRQGLEKPLEEFIEHGKDFLAKCGKGFKPSREGIKVSCNFGTWNAAYDICVEESCYGEPPSVDNGYPVVNNRSHGSSIDYHCDNYYVKAEKGAVKCLYGHWTGKGPRCIDSRCYVWLLDRRGLEKPPEDFIEHGKDFLAKCEEGFKPSREGIKVSCNFGTWNAAYDICVEESCNGVPPHMDNGYPVVDNRSHGHVIYYSCNRYYMKFGGIGDVKCSHGQWTGNTPTCIDGRCYTSQLNHPGLEKPPMDFIENGKDYPATCMKGFKANNQWKRISCNAGKWNVIDIICTKEICADEPPKIPNGKFVIQSQDNNFDVVYECYPGFEMREASSVQCLQGQWTGQPPNCDRVQSADCFCTFNPGSQQLAPFVNGSTLENNGPIKKGDSAVLSCRDQGLHLLWPNGTRTFGNAFMISEECQEWGSNILPSCEPIHPGRETTTASPRQPETCFCTYKPPRSSSLLAVVNEVSLEYGDTVKKGDGAVLSCRHEGLHLFWPNGMRTINSYMICEVCQDWGSNELPGCQPTQSGDPFIILNRNVEVQPGGAVANLRGRELNIGCISWNTIYPEWKGPVRLPISRNMVTENDQYRAFYTYMHIQSFELRHVGSYKCTAIHPTGHYYLRSTELDLITTTCKAEPPEVENGRVEKMDPKHGGTVLYECLPNFSKVKTGNVKCNMGEWQGMPPTCKDVKCYAGSVSNMTGVAEISEVTLNGDVLQVRCREGYEPRPNLQRCWNGEWRNNQESPCKEGNYEAHENDNCSCTYNNADRTISAMYFGQRLRYGDKVGKGRWTQLKCLDQAKHLILPNGTRSVNGTVRLICTVCETWEVDQLPTCEASYRPGILVPDEVAPNPSASENPYSEEGCGCIFSGDWGLRALLNGKRIWRGDYIKLGKSIRLECVKEGHRLVLPSGTVSESITWTCNRCGGASEMPTCEEVQLPEPEVHCPPIHESSAFFVLFTNGRKLNSSAHYRCKEANFKIVGGSDIRICQHSGQWSGAVPYCEAVNCPRLELTEGTTVTYTKGRRVGSEARFSCRSSSVLNGPPTLQCLQTGVWDNIQPSCRTPGCLIGDFAETAPINLLPNMEGVTEELQPVGSELSMHCEAGWVLTEDKKATCGPRGKWNFGNAKCVAGCQLNIENETTTANITPYKSYYRFGESVTVSCSVGFELTTDVERVQCMGRGWSDKIPNCKEKINDASQRIIPSQPSEGENN